MYLCILIVAGKCITIKDKEYENQDFTNDGGVDDGGVFGWLP